MQKGQIGPEQALRCPICRELFNYSERLPLLFGSGETYCKECVDEGLHTLVQAGEVGQELPGKVEKERGWRNLDILRYIEQDLSELLDDDIIEEYESMRIGKEELTEELEDTKTIMTWEVYKASDRLQKVKQDFRKHEKRRKEALENQLKSKKEDKERVALLIAQEKRRGQEIDTQIKQLQLQLKILQKREGIKEQSSYLSKIYKEMKKEWLNYDFEKVKLPENPRLQEQPQTLEEPPVKRVTKFFA